MHSLWQAADRNALRERLQRLQPTTKGRWGKFTAPEMVAHLSQSMRMATGDLPTERKNGPLRFWPLKMLVIYVMPWPKGTPTARELLEGTPTNWDADLARLSSMIEDFARLDRNRAWPTHPAFGQLSAANWGALGYKHVDHHLKQFGV